MTPQITRSVVINASPSMVWDALTRPDLMAQWMGEPETKVRVATDWRVGGPLVISGFHVVAFENTGTVLRFEPDRLLRYSHLSSLSRLPDSPEHFTVVEFRLAGVESRTSLTVNLSNFPTESIRQHLDFYWRGTIEVLKRFIEQSG